MKPKDAKKLLETIEDEGFYGCFEKNDFKEIDDSEFHTFRLRYVMARKDLIEYLGVEDV